jgi:hypothetical protein
LSIEKTFAGPRPEAPNEPEHSIQIIAALLVGGWLVSVAQSPASRPTAAIQD